MECRAGRNEIAVDWSDSATINAESRYNYLIGLAKLTGDERSEAIKQFVKEIPSYPWERFYWPKE
jgi:hypothetical protein